MKREIGKNILKFIFFLLCTYGIIRVSIWSYFQTQAFFIPFDENGTHVISHAISLLSQYGQNVVLFLATIEAGRRIAYNNKISKIQNNRAHVTILEEEVSKSQVSSNIYYTLFTVFALIDAGTNVGQFWNTTYQTAKSSIPAGFGLIAFGSVGTLFSIVVVFVEELFMNTANALLHAFNDILESLGKKRLASLDLFVDPDKVIATRMEERDGNKNYSSNQPQQAQSSQNYGNHNQSQQRTPQTNSVMSSLPRTNTPTNNTSSQPPMGYKTETPQKPPMDDALRAELMKSIEEMKSREK